MLQRIDNRVYRDKHGFVIVYIVKDDCYVYADTCDGLAIQQGRGLPVDNYLQGRLMG